MGIKEIIDKSKKPSSDIEAIIEREKKERMAELERLKLERMVEEERLRINELRKGGKTVDAGTAGEFIQSVLQLANVDPKKAAEFIRELGEEDVRKIAIMTAASNMNSPTLAALFTLARNPNVDTKTMVEFVKEFKELYQPQPQQPQVTLEGIAQLFKTAFDMAHSSQPASQTITLERAIEIVKPFFEVAMQKDREIFEERLKRLEEKIIDPREWLQSLRSDAQLLGYGPSEVDSEVEKLRIDLEKWKADRELEFRKWLTEQEIEQRKWEQVGQLFQGPLGEVLKSVGKAGAERLKGARSANFNVGEVTCPKCSKQFYADVSRNVAVCPHCGAVLARREENAPAEAGESVSDEQAEQGEQ